jgi:hypothetical protein
MTNTENSPKAVDTALAALYGKLHNAENHVEGAWSQIHFAVRDSQVWEYGNRVWKLTNDQALLALVKNIDAGSYGIDLIANLKTKRNDVKGILAEIAKLDAIYNAAPWSRFFLVTNNNGHIHSNMNCGTCYSTTRFAWNPELSGKSEADAVAELGEILCSVCFPSAPVAWTAGISKAAQVAKDEKAAKKAAKAPIFIERLPRAFNYSRTFKTQRSAQIALVGHLADVQSYGYKLDAEGVEWLTSALLAAGVTQAEIDAKVAAKVARDFKEGEKHCAALGMTKQADGTWSFNR